MAELYLDHYSLYHIAVALRERYRAIDSGASIEEANKIFENKSWMPYDPKQTMTVLEEHPNLNENLILLLEAGFLVESIKKEPKTDYELAVMKYKELYEKYYFLLKMTDSECRALMIEMRH